MPTFTRSARNTSHNSLVEPDAVCVDPQVEPAHGLYGGAQRPGDLRQPGRASEQRLTAVQDDAHLGQRVALGMLRDALPRLGDRSRAR